MEEIIDLDSENVNITDPTISKPEVDFGGGIELLMNDKKRVQVNQMMNILLKKN